MELGKNIYRLRKEKQLSQEKLAEKVNVTRQTISNWELGETFPNPEQLMLLSRALDISIDQLVGNDITPTKKVSAQDDTNTISVPSMLLTSGILAGIWSFAANQFHNYEIMLIIIGGATIGACLGALIHSIIKYLKNK